MSKEPFQPNLGVTEYRRPDGFVIRFHPSKHEKEWSSFGGPLTALQGREAAASLLTPALVEDTLGAIGTTPSYASDRATVTLEQQGRKNAVYKVHVGSSLFILVMSKGTDNLQQEAEAEYGNLSSLRTRLQERKLPLFVPQPYALEKGDDVSGFSFELLPGHFELRAATLYFPDQRRYYTAFQMISDSPRAKNYNQFAATSNVRWAMLPEERANEDPNFRIKTALIARLYLIQKLIGAVPAEFLVNAGDFMANPSEPDFDLRLITVRGGWKTLSEEEFAYWLYENQSQRPTLEAVLEKFEHPLFDKNANVLKTGLQKGHALWKKSDN